ncbi:hypothetical protein [Spiroplasma sp. BIUS-1]|uniref:hypothetical protein n=1 Tax=Spiroplasma sp. BIUS-1 TaxID=216964 RepID=UPI0013990E3B|nr:hypothetical protein [Spiroplasma sp. BIUS-1]QHX36680.1 hypothetical protein SBIUS_v1c04270 [Spiroplasma sp. BIUS-1]
MFSNKVFKEALEGKNSIEINSAFLSKIKSSLPKENKNIDTNFVKQNQAAVLYFLNGMFSSIKKVTGIEVQSSLKWMENPNPHSHPERPYEWRLLSPAEQLLLEIIKDSNDSTGFINFINYWLNNGENKNSEPYKNEFETWLGLGNITFTVQ